MMRDDVEYVVQNMRKRLGFCSDIVLSRPSCELVVLPVIVYYASMCLPHQKTFSDKLRKVTREFEQDQGIYDKTEEDRLAFHRILSPEVLRENRRLFEIIKGIYPGNGTVVEAAEPATAGRETRAIARVVYHPIPFRSAYAPRKEL